MREPIEPVSLEALVGEVAKIKLAGYRFVTMTNVPLDEASIDILYHFDKDLELKHLRLTVPQDIPIPSISGVYLSALLVENEIQDLSGVKFSGLAIDYNRTFYLDEEVKVTPFCKYTVGKAIEKESSGEGPAAIA